MIQVLLVDDVGLILQLEYLLRIYLGSIGSSAFDHLATIIRWFEQLDIFHFLVISGIVVYLALSVLPDLILAAPSLDSRVV